MACVVWCLGAYFKTLINPPRHIIQSALRRCAVVTCGIATVAARCGRRLPLMRRKTPPKGGGSLQSRDGRRSARCLAMLGRWPRRPQALNPNRRTDQVPDHLWDRMSPQAALEPKPAFLCRMQFVARVRECQHVRQRRAGEGWIAFGEQVGALVMIGQVAL